MRLRQAWQAVRGSCTTSSDLMAGFFNLLEDRLMSASSSSAFMAYWYATLGDYVVPLPEGASHASVFPVPLLNRTGGKAETLHE